jgi:iron complex outermembrane receptor protein
MIFRPRPFLFIPACALAAQSLSAQSAPPVPVEKLSPLVVAEKSSMAEKSLLPQATESITATRIAETVNALDTEDALKYLPSVFLRKRNNGDTQAVMATRTWGVSSSARSLVYADGVLLTALIANNNSIGGPRWGLVAPAEIERVDLMYGPFAAQYPGNSLGAVLEITTRQPERSEASLTQTFALQHHALYGTRDTYLTSQTALSFGQRAGKFSVWLGANYQDSHSQPLAYVTGPSFPAGTTGGFAANNKLGAPANILGATGLLHTRMTTAKLKLAYDLTPTLRAAYTVGLWRNDADSDVETYLTNAAGQPTYAGLAGFASGRSVTIQEHSSHSVTLRSATRGVFDFEFAASRYRYDRDEQRSPVTVSTTTADTPSFGSAGRVAVLGGTGWSQLDLKGLWRPDGKEGAHTVSFGIHDDRAKLYNPTYNTTEWTSGGFTSVSSEGDGKTRTQALWLQDAWALSPAVKFTAGVRGEDWRAYDGLNRNGATLVRQTVQSRRKLSPKAALAWAVSPAWSATLSVGRAYRFATPAELYQLVTTGTTFTSPNPDLKPDAVVATELKIERRLPAGRVRLSLFQDDIHDAIISQFNPLVAGSPTLYSYLSNVDHVRARGVELVVQHNHVWITGLEVQGSVTYLDARTLALSGRASATAPASAALDKKLPNIPDWRGTVQLSYRPGERWTFSAAGRYSAKMFTTLDNADVNPNTYQGFAAWFVADVRVHVHLSRRWSASLGIDNLLDREYFLFHPFPQRTFVTEAKFSF